MKELIGQLDNTRRSQKTFKINDLKILFLVRKNPYITSTQVKNNRKEFDVSLSNLKLKTFDEQRVYNNMLTTGDNEKRKARLDFAKSSENSSPVLEQHSSDR